MPNPAWLRRGTGLHAAGVIRPCQPPRSMTGWRTFCCQTFKPWSRLRGWEEERRTRGYGVLTVHALRRQLLGATRCANRQCCTRNDSFATGSWVGSGGAARRDEPSRSPPSLSSAVLDVPDVPDCSDTVNTCGSSMKQHGVDRRRSEQASILSKQALSSSSEPGTWPSSKSH